MIWLIIVYSLLILYSCIIVFYTIHWKKSKDFFRKTNSSPTTTFSIIIPARNEAANIIPLLSSITKNNYPQHLFEIIVIDDHSTDDTYQLVKNFSNQSHYLITVKSLIEDHINSYKKKAIETGIALAKNEWIICTDADCEVSREWLSVYDQFIQENHPQFVAAPVVFTSGNSVLNVFQNLDFITLQGITAASVISQTHNMCNGANVAYTKAAFHKVNGFAGIDHIASGDDLLLMNKIDTEFPGKSMYIKSQAAIVSTIPPQNWKAFFNQRIRWASKSTHYDDKRIISVLLVVYLLNLSIFITGLLALFNMVFIIPFLLIIVLKTIIEFPFVYSVAHFFRRSKYMIWFLFFQPLHIFYTIVAGFLGVFGSYQWKERKVK